MIRTLSILALCATAAACSTAGGAGVGAGIMGDKPPVTPTDHFSLQAAQAPEQIALAPHAEGLSDNQRAALADYARRYIDAGAEGIKVQVPADGGEPATRTAWAAKAALEAQGVKSAAVTVGPYSADKQGAPILIAFDRYEAVVPKCGDRWTNLTATRDNSVPFNFGCATTANMAAQIADPRDIKGGRQLDPADATRRAVVMDKYRKGEVTNARTDDKAKGTVSQAVQ